MPNVSASARLRVLPAVLTLLTRRTPADQLAGAAHSTWSEGPPFADAQQLLEAEVAADAVILYPADAHQGLTWLQALRRSPRFALAPIFLNRSCGAAVDALSDGLASNLDAATPKAAAIAARAAALGRRQTADSDERLLAFLYLRPERILTPFADWRDAQIYRYPLIDALGRSGEDGFLMLDRLRRRGLLETAELIERMHTCPACSAGQLLFIETCPQCGSIDTTVQNFLHCYACGNVATQEEYLKQDGLSCPKCAARLRHIGVDYDRALETLACNSCRGRFTEPAVKARCLHCQKLSGTDELTERSYYGLRLSAAGELAARTGQIGDFFKLIDEFSQAHPEYFIKNLDWLLGLSRRHAELQFGLVSLKFANVRQLAARLPHQRVAQMFDALAQRLRTLVRTTDLFMRDDDEYCWLLLPQTSPEGVDKVMERIAALREAALPDEGLRIEIATAAFSSLEPNEGMTDAKVLMGTLRSRVG